MLDGWLLGWLDGWVEMDELANWSEKESRQSIFLIINEGIIVSIALRLKSWAKQTQRNDIVMKRYEPWHIKPVKAKIHLTMSSNAADE